MTQDAWMDGRSTTWKEEWLDLWDGINAYVVACGGDPEKAFMGRARGKAPAERIEGTISKIVSSALCGPSIPKPTAAVSESLEQRTWDLFAALLKTESTLIGDLAPKMNTYGWIAVRTPQGIVTCETMLGGWSGLTIGGFTGRHFVSWAEANGHLSTAKYGRIGGVKKRWRKVLL